MIWFADDGIINILTLAWRNGLINKEFAMTRTIIGFGMSFPLPRYTPRTHLPSHDTNWEQWTCQYVSLSIKAYYRDDFVRGDDHLWWQQGSASFIMQGESWYSDWKQGWKEFQLCSNATQDPRQLSARPKHLNFLSLVFPTAFENPLGAKPSRERHRAPKLIDWLTVHVSLHGKNSSAS